MLCSFLFRKLVSFMTMRSSVLKEINSSRLQHGPVLVVAIRHKVESSLCSNASCILERTFNDGLTLKIISEVDGPKPASTSGSAPLNVRVALRENEFSNRLQKSLIERAVHSALIPALVTPDTGWAGISFDLNFILELSAKGVSSLRERNNNLEEECVFLQLVVGCVNAGSVALTARGIPLRDVAVGAVCSLSCAQTESPSDEFQLIVDPCPEDMADATFVIAASSMPSLGQFTNIWWHSSHLEDRRKLANVIFSKHRAQILPYLLATAAALKPVLLETLDSETVSNK